MVIRSTTTSKAFASSQFFVPKCMPLEEDRNPGAHDNRVIMRQHSWYTKRAKDLLATALEGVDERRVLVYVCSCACVRACC